MLSTVSKFVYGEVAEDNSSDVAKLKILKEKSDAVKLKIREKHEFYFLDPIGSLVSLALSAAFDGGNPKISCGSGRLFVKSDEMATEAWILRWIKPEEVPKRLKSALHSADRTWNQETREDLAFFNHAIPYMAKLYPTDSLILDHIDKEDINLHAIMIPFWKQIFAGIKTLEKSYGTELLEPLVATNKIRLNKTNFQLPLQENMGRTFTAWEEVIKRYIEQVPIIPRFANILETTEMNVNKGKEVKLHTKEIKSDNNEKHIVVANEIKAENQQESDVKNEKPPIIDSLLFGLQDTLFNFDKRGLNAVDEKILLNFQHIFLETITKGTIPETSHPLTAKVRKLWPLKDIQYVSDKIEEIKKCTTSSIRQTNFLKLELILEEKAMQYMELVEDGVDEAMTL